MINIIVLCLTTKSGPTKSSAFIIGKYLAYVLWGIILLAFVKMASAVERSGKTSSIQFVISTIIGGLLLITALKTYVGEDDPDAGPSKVLTSLEKLSPGQLLLVGSALSIIQLRIVALMPFGSAIIAVAQLPAGPFQWCGRC